MPITMFTNAATCIYFLNLIKSNLLLSEAFLKCSVVLEIHHLFGFQSKILKVGYGINDSNYRNSDLFFSKYDAKFKSDYEHTGMIKSATTLLENVIIN